MEENKEVETITNEEQPVQEQPTVKSVEPNNNDKKGNNKKLITIILIIAASLVVIGAVVLFLVFNNSEDDSDDDYYDEPETEEKNTESEDSKEDDDENIAKYYKYDEKNKKFYHYDCDTFDGKFTCKKTEKDWNEYKNNADSNGYIHTDYFSFIVPIYYGYDNEFGDNYFSFTFEMKNNDLLYSNDRIGEIDTGIKEKIKYMTVGYACDGTNQILLLTESNQVYISNLINRSDYMANKTCKRNEDKTCPNIKFEKIPISEKVVNITRHADHEETSCTGTNLSVVLSDGSIRAIEKEGNSYTIGTQNKENMKLKD